MEGSLDRDLVRASKFLCLVLRHEPQVLGLSLGRGGWVRVDELVSGAKKAGARLDLEMLRRVVAQDQKKRFTLSEDGERIKANYGHSIQVDLDLTPEEPPELLFHGTAESFLESIRQDGITRKGRRYVHLSGDEVTAAEVGRRHGVPIVLRIQARLMHQDGFEFLKSESGIWLTGTVPPHYILFP